MSKHVDKRTYSLIKFLIGEDINHNSLTVGFQLPDYVINRIRESVDYEDFMFVNDSETKEALEAAVHIIEQLQEINDKLDLLIVKT